MPQNDTSNPMASMESYYCQRAPIYDQSMGYDQPDMISALKPVITYLQEHLRNRAVLELACGPCFWTQHVSQTARTIIATDINATMLQEARKKSLDWHRVSLQIADAYNLPDFPEAFDAAFAVDTFCHMPISRRKDFLGGLHRRLIPSSVVMLCSQLPRDNSWTEQWDNEGNHLQTRSLPDGSQYSVIKNFPTDEEIQSTFGSYSDNVTIQKFPTLHRYIIKYQVND